MGYFSKRHIDFQENDEESAYHGFEEQLLWRYEELKDRYSELLDEGAPYSCEEHFSLEDYRYASPKRFGTMVDIYRALEIAKEDLKNRCDLEVDDESWLEKETDVEEIDPNQISMMEVLLLPQLLYHAIAA